MSPIKHIRTNLLRMSKEGLARLINVTGMTILAWEKKPDSIRLKDVHAIINVASSKGIHLTTYDFVPDPHGLEEEQYVKNDPHVSINVHRAGNDITISQGGLVLFVSRKSVDGVILALNNAKGE